MWRVDHVGRDSMYYEELRDGSWERLDLGGEMLVGRAHHVIYFGSREAWKRQPEWAQGRRDEIVDRIKTAFPIPDYEYSGEAVLTETDRRLLVDAAGGLSDEQCLWVGCSERALKGKAICVVHARQSEEWR
jgi:hypothetical protein